MLFLNYVQVLFSWLHNDNFLISISLFGRRLKYTSVDENIVGKIPDKSFIWN